MLTLNQAMLCVYVDPVGVEMEGSLNELVWTVYRPKNPDSTFGGLFYALFRHAKVMGERGVFLL